MADTFIVIGTGPAVNVVLGGAGASAYQIWLDAGNAGTEQDFLDSLEGPQGPAGATGATGATGPQGDPGFISLNGLTDPTQAFAAGTSGTDFGIDSSGSTHTFNLPSSSASNRGLLLAMDWTTFNNKVGGSGTANYLPKFTASGTVGDSLLFENSSNMGLGTTSPASKLEVVNNSGGIYALTLSSNDNTYRAGIKFNVVRTTNAGIAFDIFNLTAGLASSPIVGGAIGYYGVANTPSTTKYLYLGSKSTTDYQDATLKIAPNGTIAINLPGVDVPNAALQVLGTGNSSASFTARFHDNTGTNNALTIRDDGLSGFGTNTQTSRVDVNGANGYAQLRLRATYTPTGTSDALGNTGDTAWDANYFYIKTAAGWKRAALSTF